MEVIRNEEKGSDVNRTLNLLNDGWLNAYDCGVVASNDSDVAEAMRLVSGQHGFSFSSVSGQNSGLASILSAENTS